VKNRLTVVFLLAGIASTAQAQTTPSSTLDAAASRTRFETDAAKVKVDTSASSKAVTDDVNALILAKKGQGSPLQAAVNHRAVMDSIARSPGSYGTVAPMTSRNFMVKTHVMMNVKAPPASGEPLRLELLESRLPVMGVPALQSVLSGTWIWKISVGVSSVGEALIRNTKISDQGGSYVFTSETAARYDKGVPGSGALLAKYNEQAVLEQDVEAANRQRNGEILLQASRDSKARIQPKPEDGFAAMRNGVSMKASYLGQDTQIAVVTVVNASSKPYDFRPQDFIYLASPARNISPMVAEPFRKGPLPMLPAAACIADLKVDATTATGLRPVDKGIAYETGAPESETGKAVRQRNNARATINGLKALGILAPGLGTGLQAIAKGGAYLTTMDDLNVILKGRTLAGDRKSRFDTAADKAMDVGLKKGAEGIGGRRPSTSDTLDMAADAPSKKRDLDDLRGKTPKNSYDKENDARDAADAATIAREDAEHHAAERKRIEDELEHNIALSSDASRLLQRDADKRFAQCRTSGLL
jgi:hypothetical protein